MSTEARIESERRRKLDEIRELGVNVYPTRFERTHHIDDVLEKFESKDAASLEAQPVAMRLAGRIVALRKFGKAAFAHISNGAAKIQIYVKRDVVEDPGFRIFKKLDVGDFIGVEGELFRTKTDELTLNVRQLSFLSKALRPLPEKWHGLTDVEIRYRQRYLDLIANQRSREVFFLRSRLIQELRAFFAERDYVEVETPMLQSVAGGATARPFTTFHNALGMELYLRIAPELFLKRLVVGGFERVYEINRNFRNEGISTKHNPEFTMLEFYEAYSDCESMISLTEDMFSRISDRLCGGEPVDYDGHRIDLKPPFARMTMIESLKAKLLDKGVELSDAEVRSVDSLRSIHERFHFDYDPNAGWGKLVTSLFEELVEPELIQPTFVTDYPLEVSPLSKQRADDAELVERFELFIAGMECANGFSELNDPDEQRARFDAQLTARQAGDDEAHAMDEDYVRALLHGLPPTGGEGVGIDRLTMILTDSRSIRDVILFPHLRPETGRESAGDDAQHDADSPEGG